MSSALHQRLVLPIHRVGTGWKVAGPEDPPEHTTSLAVSLHIRGTPENGYHLIAEPQGLFTADTWYATRDQAIADAHLCFSAPPEAWRPAPRATQP
jgi:hypothetical protein